MGKTTPYYVWLAVLCGAILRLYGLGWRALNVDEAMNLLSVSRSVPSPEVFSHLSMLPYPPLLYPIFHPFAWGETPEWLYRVLPAVCGIISIWLAFKVGCLLSGPSLGALASFVFALFPVHVFYSQTASPYPILILLTLTSMYFYVRILFTGDKSVGAGIGYLVPTALSVYLHYLAFLPLCYQNIFVLFGIIKRDFNRAFIKRWLGIQGALFLLLIPVLIIFVLQLKGSPGISWLSFYLRNMRPGLLIPVYLVLTYGFPSDEIYTWLDRFYGFDVPFRQLIELLDVFPTIAITSLMFLFLLTSGMIFCARGTDLMKKRFIVGYFFFPIIGLCLVSYIKMSFYPRYFLIILPAYAMILASGILRIGKGRIRKLITFIVCITLLGFTVRQYRCSGGEDYRGTVNHIINSYRSGDIVALSYYYIQPAVIYYLQGRPIPLYAFENIRQPENNLQETILRIKKQISDLSQRYKRLWLVPSFNPLWYKDYLIAEELDKRFSRLDFIPPTGVKPGYILYDMKKGVSGP